MSIALLDAAITADNALQTMGQYFWAILPTIIAIVLALVTKEVYISLFIGIFFGAMYLGNWNPITAFVKLFESMAGAVGPSTAVEGEEVIITGAGNAGILIFVIELGILVMLMQKAGGAQAFGDKVFSRIKSRKGAMLATTAFSCCMFMDDYFNRLSVGPIMQPLNDKYRISRAKTAFIVGSVSVSVCILAPISSWASAIAGSIADGSETTSSAQAFGYYVQTIFCNFYPILLLMFLVVTIVLGIDLFGLHKHEKRAITTGDVTGGLEAPKLEEIPRSGKRGTVWDLIVPIVVLIASCCTLLLVKKDGEAMFDTNTSLAIGGCLAIIVCVILYLPRRLMTLKEYTGCFASGFKSIADVIIILAFAWTLSSICEKMELSKFVEAFATWMGDTKSLLPAIFFLASMGTAFATGTSWGTFGIMVPIVVQMGVGDDLMVLTIAAVLSGAVFGDHVSPISDATILSAASCRCNHLGYVKAQMPNALMIAGITLITYIVAGVTELIWVGWIVAGVLFAALIVTLYFVQRKKGRLTDKLYKETLAAEKNAVGETPDEKTE